MPKTIYRFAFAILCAFFLAGCAVSPRSSEANALSESLLDRQLDAVDTYLAQAPSSQRTLVYVGSALHSQSLAFQGDVLLMRDRLKEKYPDVQTVLLSNQLARELTYPFATSSTLAKVFQRVGVWSRKHPIALVVLISTHGNVDLLSVNIAESYWPAVRSVQLKTWLDGVAEVPTALILSACFSGSLIPPLEAPHRVILTAATHNRSSFGCAFEDKNTWFIGSLLGEGWSTDKSWQENHQRTAATVARLEEQRRLPASSPQIAASPANAQRKVGEFLVGPPAR